MNERRDRRRRRFRYSLRTLLLLVAIVGVWLGLVVNRARQQQSAIKEIQALGGWVYYDYQLVEGNLQPVLDATSGVPEWLLESIGPDYFHDVVIVNMVYKDGPDREDNQRFTDDVKKHLAAFPKLQRLLVANGQCTDDLVQEAAGLRHLTLLCMWNAAGVTDAGVAHLANHPTLTYLHLEFSQITEDSLRIFGTLPQIEHLSLQDTRVTDVGLAHLRNLTHLQELFVLGDDAHITDDGLKHLENLTNLKLLLVPGTLVSPAGLRRLQAALPNVQLPW